MLLKVIIFVLFVGIAIGTTDMNQQQRQKSKDNFKLMIICQ